ncbi:MAG: terminase large subunit, partial [Acidobacteria bacterium]|nr:terminase large subunit [Acidobacteriota bacterium]
MPRVRRIALKRRAVADPIAEALADLTGGARVIRFVEGFLRGEKGEYAGKPFQLLPFQHEIICGLYDPIDNTGARLIRAGLVFLPRKNGKTSIAAAIAVYETFEGGAGAQVVIAANSRDQASLLFDVAASMVEQCPELAARAVISRAKKRITDKRTRSTLRVISAEASTAHGLDCTCWIYDELHEAPNRELYDALATSGGARRNSLGLCISTAGHDKQSVLGELYDHAKAAAADASLDPGFYSYIAEADAEADWSDEATWRQANPALGAFRNLDEIRQLAARAKQVPSQVDAFRRLYLNQWTQAE